MTPTCFLDMDGVVTDFVGGALAYHGKKIPYREIRWGFVEMLGLSETEFWGALGADFWSGLRPTVEMEGIVDAAERRFGRDNVFLLSSPCLTTGCITGKAFWVEKHLPDYSRRLLLTNRKDVLARPGYVLVDDGDHNRGPWERAGGTFVMVPRPWNQMREAALDGCVSSLVRGSLTCLTPSALRGDYPHASDSQRRFDSLFAPDVQPAVGRCPGPDPAF